jgi:hypothetical protein
MQAEAVTRVVRQVQQIDFSDLAARADLANLASKVELAELRHEMQLEFANVRRERAETKTEIIKCVLGIGLAPVAAIVALLELLPGGHP